MRLDRSDVSLRLLIEDELTARARERAIESESGPSRPHAMSPRAGLEPLKSNPLMERSRRFTYDRVRT